MPDVARWQISNLLLLEKSPMLWFYLGHRGTAGTDRFEKRVNDGFLDRRFVPARTQLRNYTRGWSDLDYRLAPAAVPYPPKLREGLTAAIVSRANERLTMREILSDLGVDIADQKVLTDIRVETTTSLRPHLRAV